MRLICTFTEEKKAHQYSQFLLSQSIKNNCEMVKNEDWGSNLYGETSWLIWIYSEDDVDAALKFYNDYLKNPDDPKYQKIKVTLQNTETPIPTVVEKEPPKKKEPNLFNQFGKVTLSIVILCVLLFLPNLFALRTAQDVPKKMPEVVVYSSTINQILMFDYPKTFELLEKITSIYGIQSLTNPSSLPPAARTLYAEYQNSSFWTGIYSKIVSFFKNPEAEWNFQAPMFEKISQGQYWRLFTPAFLHFGLLHILFNMIWAIVLGRQIEQKIGAIKYVILIAISACITNTSQYLMSGPFFIGYSGVVCSMIMFIVARKKVAVWEGYQLHRSTIIFVSIYVVSILSVQILSFFLEIYGISPFPLRIANTAHITGGMIGYLIGCTPFFAWKN